MKFDSNAEFARRMSLLARSAAHFVPIATYDRDGDCIEFLAKPDPFYAERLDDLVTVYFSQETSEIVGSLIKGVARFYETVLQRMPGFRIVVQDGRIRLEHIFLARMWSTEPKPDDLATLTYRKLIEVADESGVEVETGLCSA